MNKKQRKIVNLAIIAAAALVLLGMLANNFLRGTPEAAHRRRVPTAEETRATRQAAVVFQAFRNRDKSPEEFEKVAAGVEADIVHDANMLFAALPSEPDFAQATVRSPAYDANLYQVYLPRQGDRRVIINLRDTDGKMVFIGAGYTHK